MEGRVSDDDLLPGNATAWERAQSKTSARLLATDTNVIRRERDPLHCDAAFAPFLGMERSVHHYTGENEALDRARIASSFADHCSYGTPAALEQEIALDTGQDVRVVEFFEDATLEWPDFVVETLVDPGEPTPDLAALQASATRRKNVRDWPHVRVRGRQPVAPLHIAGASHMTSAVRILPEDALPPTPQIFVGAGTRAIVRNRVLPL
jgi:phage tail P2-like protein